MKETIKNFFTNSWREGTQMNKLNTLAVTLVGSSAHFSFYFIFKYAHNVGDIALNSNQVNTLPSLASKVKAGLKIKSPNCVAYDILFGCPGWVEGVIQAKAFIKAGMAKKCLVVGADTLSRVLDQSDRDSMIYADGAGATVVEEVEGDRWKTQRWSNGVT